MPDRERVIKGLEQFRADLKPFCGNHADWERFDAALTLLKEQEPKPVGKEWNECPNCGKVLSSIEHIHFCGLCGQAVKWDV